MKELIDDYKRRLTTVETMLKEFKSNGSEHDIRKEERLKTKASEYRTIIAELERFENEHICLTKEEIRTFMNDVNEGTGAWSDTSYRICKFIGINPSDGV